MKRAQTRCKYCGRRIGTSQRLRRGQDAHTNCITKRPYDLVINCGNFHIELHTELVTNKSLLKLLDEVKHLSNQLSNNEMEELN